MLMGNIGMRFHPRHLLHVAAHYSGLEDEQKLDSFMDVFEECILDEIDEGDDIGIYLTGGFDSRSVLSVLVANGYSPTAITYPRGEDVEIAKKVAEEYDLEHITSPVGSAESADRSNQSIETHRQLSPDFDVVFTGKFMDELWGVFDYGRKRAYTRSLRRVVLPQTYQLLKINNNLAAPAVDPRCVEALVELNDYYLMEKRLQKEVIKEFEPELLDVDIALMMPRHTRVRNAFKDRILGVYRFG